MDIGHFWINVETEFVDLYRFFPILRSPNCVLSPTKEEKTRQHVYSDRQLFIWRRGSWLTWRQNRSALEKELSDCNRIFVMRICMHWSFVFNVNEWIFMSKLRRKRMNRESRGVLWKTNWMPCSWQQKSWKDFSSVISPNNCKCRRMTSSLIKIWLWRNSLMNSCEYSKVFNNRIRVFLFTRNWLANWAKMFIVLA